MAIIEKIAKYVAKKPTEKNDHNKTKHDFFYDILQLWNDNLLTVERLTLKLEALEETERHKLFYYGRKWGNTDKEKASPNCEAGQLILELYNALKVPMPEDFLEKIVNDGISEKGLIFLKGYHYQKWLKKPLFPYEIDNLERELKGLLKLDLKNNLSLAAALHQDYEKLDIFLLLKKAPAYLPEVIYRLYQLAESDEQKKDLINFLVEKAREDESLSLVKILSEVNVDLAATLVKKGLQNLFALPHSMQNAICTFLEQKKDFATLNDLRDQIFNENENAPLQDIDREQFFKLLNEGQYRKDASLAKHEAHDTFNRLVDMVYEKAITNPAQAFAQLQSTPALQLIENYLKKDPADYKASFFSDLAADIKVSGLSVKVLNNRLRWSDTEKLFDKWCGFGGPKSSRAAALMEELYKFASQGASLDTDLMINQGVLPDEAKIDFEGPLKKEVENRILQPQRGSISPIQRKISAALDYFKSFQHFMNRASGYNQKKAEAIYQNYLLQKGLSLANDQEQAIFDPQGHVLVTVSLDEDDYANIVRQINKEAGGDKEILEQLLGAKLTNPTFCNLDIAAHKELRTKFIVEAANKTNLNKDVFDRFLSSWDRGSVIPLQEEMSMHISLSLRAIEKFINQEGPLFVLSEKGRQQLFLAINGLVMAKFSSALVAANQGNINYEQLNKHLDEAREVLAPECRKLLVDAISSEMSEKDFKSFKNNLLPQLNDNFFTSTTATGLDYLRTDAANETIVRISGTEKTSHSKKQGKKEQALRLILRNHYNAYEDNHVTSYSENSVEARVPSIADINLEHSISVFDVSIKLELSHELLSKKLGGYKGPLIYNLLTSLHSNAYDNSFFEANNKQRTSASRILKGSHLYNYLQLQSGETKALVYVQNIPVNQHTNKLDLHSLDEATAEATLMTEVALLATFEHHASVFPPSLRKRILETQAYIHENYLKFLPAFDDGNHYFKASDPGKESIAVLENQKALWQAHKIPPADNLQALAVQVLFKMMANKDYQKKQFGLLTQALSVFVEPMSQSGCKSANERYQSVYGRVELLKSMIEIPPEKRTYTHKKILSVLKCYVKGSSTAKELQAALDTAYNRTLYKAPFSPEDQGGGSKVQATSNTSDRGKISEFDTNFAETNFLTRLKQKFAASMQAHKAHLTKVFTELFNDKKPAETFKISI
ncbi:MAG: hypothetical protein H0T84_12800 [Tatlockia sp.]|nr:hypothetical protein [Tatlockia sp.]